MTAGTRYLFAINFERLIAQATAVSLFGHVLALAAFIFLPGIFGSDRVLPQPIEVDLSYSLPKGPGLGPMAPDRDQAAVRTADPRRLSDIMKEREQKQSADAVKLTEHRQVETNKLGWKDRQRLEAIEKLREKRALIDSVGGGGQGTSSTTGVLGIYIANVRSRILSVWSLPGGLPADLLEKMVYVRIYVAANGSVLKQEMAKPSGFEPLDRSCSSAIVKASPLPPPPSLLADELRNKGIVIRFIPREKQH